LLGPVVALLAGCTCGRNNLQQALQAGRKPPAHALDARYPIRCPDVVEVEVAGRPDLSGKRPVGADGQIAFVGGQALAVEGQTAPEVAREVARQAGLPADRVAVHVASYNSRHVYVFGDAPGLERAVHYRGPETVLDLLQRVGGIPKGTDLGEIRVVRDHVADGRPPEVFHVDLNAILVKHDPQTNITLEPFDQVHIGQNRPARLACCIPPWLRPLYQRACGLGK
jgi:protein involved in polysaccharide export with SLBB domain